ncbi:YjeF_N domain-containing protein [Pyricularia oryzae 70-15]|uniref:Enhancer of mRNA-decapping protein 3 n=1 Tax=Pyricularia oryzae (strain 70-15 / ATCC MYA-4617 / FGSC 8958) TaxID=242507 RepID=G4N542_PYRO7|nr:YjeF_N domain-containing protein [Pyricularia oryzae 70-15]EHA52953.1 YjeF_N domain-containing protein [Pyricularia oryzae 70-15]KAI7911806.1 YjeF_N domain-containing protein [Pyricularia oryzae]KAI7912823.1 YjeF_N domain-containing protein [Pyricularia oryzae]
MASQFIGAHMLVTLHQPPTRLRGVVTDVRSGHSLTLSNVWSADTNVFLQPTVTIQAINVANLVEVPHPPVAPSNGPIAAIPGAHVPPPQVVPLADPAIVAMSKPPSGPRAQPNTSEKREPVRTTSGETTPVPATLAGSVAALTVDTSEVDAGADGDSDAAATVKATSVPVPTKKKGRRARAAKAGRGAAAQADPATPGSAGRQTPTVQGSKGWRQTPMLEDTSSFQPYNSLRKSRGRKGNNLAVDNGWASEDVTDVQEMGEFDFEGSLAKFDKHTLFDQMRKDDEIDDASRLVSHNRLPKPKPGTAGGKNLHYTENVLDATPTSVAKGKGELPNDFWNSEADDGVVNGSERLSGRELGSRQSSRRAESKISTNRRSQSRKASAATVTGPVRTGSSGPNQTLASPGLVLLPSGRRAETVSALQMINLENIAHNELGLTDEMMTENAARGLAEVALAALADPAVRLISGTGGNTGDSSGPPPATVAILAGNNKSGIRAVAAARHLRNKGVTPVVCVVGMERGERELLEGMRQQLRLLRNFGVRTCFSKSEFFEHVRKISIPTLTVDTPRGAIIPKPPAVTLIIDALLGLATPFDELRTGEQATVYELIEWANRNEAFVLAVDVPTGVDPTTGHVSIVDGTRLYVRPRFVVAMGAPKKGLLETMMSSEGEEAAAEDWKLSIADIGLGPAVWRRAGTKIRRGIDFGDRWVVDMKFSRNAGAASAATSN